MVKKYLDSKDQVYEVINLDEQPEAVQKVMELSGSQTVPVTVIENDNNQPDVIVGFSPPKLAAALGL